MVKRIISIGVVLVMMLSLFACGKPEYNTDAESGFYTLQEAYDLGLLKKADLKDIAYYSYGKLVNDNGKEIEFTPRLKTPEFLSKDIEDKIKEAHLYPVKAEILISSYYGTYNGCVALTIHIKDDDYLIVMPRLEAIGGYMVLQPAIRIMLWKE